MAMTSRELVQATLDFQGPERIPVDLWVLPAIYIGREQAVKSLLSRHPTDFHRARYRDPLAHPAAYTRGSYLDAWGCRWLVLQDGMIGEVKESPLADYSDLAGYHWPAEGVNRGWENTAADIAAHRDRFILGDGGDPWERMQFLRGPANLYMDLADPNCEELYVLRDRIFAFYRAYVERWITFDIDGVIFSDDWGSQRSLLISPAKWREFFRPKYQELFDIVRNAGKRVFMHSDGYIVDIYPDLIEMGVNALNSQVWCMGLETLAPFAGKITFWGELDRQRLMPHGTPAEIRQAAGRMVSALYRSGGLIGQAEVDGLTPMENVEAALTAWEAPELVPR